MMENLKPIFHLGLLPYLSDSIYGMPTACYFNADALSQMLNRNITKQMLFLFFFIILFYLFTFGCFGSLLLCTAFSS